MQQGGGASGCGGQPRVVILRTPNPLVARGFRPMRTHRGVTPKATPICTMLWPIARSRTISSRCLVLGFVAGLRANLLSSLSRSFSN